MCACIYKLIIRIFYIKIIENNNKLLTIFIKIHLHTNIFLCRHKKKKIVSVLENLKFTIRTCLNLHLITKSKTVILNIKWKVKSIAKQMIKEKFILINIKDEWMNNF